MDDNSDKKPTFDYRGDSGRSADERADPYYAKNLYKQEQEGGENANRESGSKSDNSNYNDSQDENSSTSDRLKSKESKSPWRNNTSTSGGQGVAPTKAKFSLSKAAMLRRFGPAGIIVVLALGTGGMGAFFVGPSLLLNHMTEGLGQRFDVQRPAMNKRNDKMLDSKTADKTKGYCGKVVTIRCRYASFSEKEIKRLEKQGITVKPAKKNAFGRYKPTSFEYTHDGADGKKVTKSYNAKDFMNEMRDPKSVFRRQVWTAYHPILAGWADKTFFKRFRDKLGLSKARPFDKSSDTKSRWKRMKEIVNRKGGNSADVSQKSEGECSGDEAAKKACEDERKKKSAEAEKDAKDLKDGIEDRKNGGGGAKAKLGIKGALNILGAPQAACSVKDMLNKISSGAKKVRSAQMMGFAMIFFTLASMQRAGDAVDEDINWAGNLLTKTGTDADGQTQSKNATDSFGFKNAAYGDKEITTSAVAFSAASAASKDLSDLSNKIGKLATKQVCDTVNNNFVNMLGLGIGVGSLLVPGVGVARVAYGAASMAGAAALGPLVDTFVVPQLVKLAAGVLIDETSFGEAAGDAMATGYQLTSSEVANGGGNAPLTPAQAAANDVDMRIVATENADYIKGTRSPLDVSTQYTALGSIVNKSLPYFSDVTSVPSLISRSLGLLSKSTANILSPAAKAAPFSDEDAPLTVADATTDDPEYKELGLATTKQGTPYVGSPPQVADIEQNEAYKRLVGHVTYWEEITEHGIIPHWYADPHINWETGEPITEKYKQFIKNCIERPAIWGETEGVDWAGKECMIGGENGKTGRSINVAPTTSYTKDPEGITPENDSDEAKNSPYITDDTQVSDWERNYFYAWYQIHRVGSDREEDLPENAASIGSSGDSQQAGDAAAVGDISKGEFAQAYTGPCTEGTKDIGIQDAYIDNHKLPSRMCAIEGFKSSSEESKGQFGTGYSGGDIIVNARVSALWKTALTAMKSAGVLQPTAATSSFRTMAHQTQLFHDLPDPKRVARPGYSNHQGGYAIDFNMGNGLSNTTDECAGGDPCKPNRSSKLYDWLVANGSKYKISQYSAEYWHWEPAGLR